MFTDPQKDMLRKVMPDKMVVKKSVGAYLLTLAGTIAANIMTAKSTRVIREFTPAEYFAFLEANPEVLRATMIKYNLRQVEGEPEATKPATA